MKNLSVFLILFTMLACRPETNNVQPDQSTSQTQPGVQSDSREMNENAEKRLAWQKPDLVINKLGDLNDKVIADIGAGTGYFTFRLATKASKVIALDIDPNMIDLIELFRSNLDKAMQERIETRVVSPNDPKLGFSEVDIAIIINTIGYIEDRETYLRNLRQSIKEDGMLMIVDFKLKRIPGNIAADPAYRVSILDMEEALTSAGYHSVFTDDTSLDYQYIILASR